MDMVTNTATSTQSFFTPVETSRGSDILKPTDASSFTGNQFNMSESFQIGSSGTSGTGSFIPQQQNMAFVEVGTQDGNSKEALNIMTNTAGSTQSFLLQLKQTFYILPACQMQDQDRIWLQIML